jgi:hypothetical protein
LIFAENSSIVSGTNFMRPGTHAVDAFEMLIPITFGQSVLSMHLQSRIGPGAARVDTVTLRKNGIDTAITVSLTGAQTTGSITGTTVAYVLGDTLSVKIVVEGSSTLSDLVVVLGMV